ncbi:MAG: hypothetical protein ACFFDN_10750 [Candidatus Hodarchaeota archaeon]
MKQPTPSPEIIILAWVSNSGSITLQIIISCPTITINLSGMFFLKKKSMIEEKKNRTVRKFSFSDNVMRHKM